MSSVPVSESLSTDFSEGRLNMNNNSISSKSETDWARLDAMADEDIDLSDCPEVTPEMFARAIVRRGPTIQKTIPIRYQLIIYWSGIDRTFLVEVPELPGCMADGETYQEAVQNVEVVIQEWIDTAQVLGRSIPEPKGRLMFA
jgi:predicted RNase H-like HicB family nuclease